MLEKKASYFSLPDAKEKIAPYQKEFLERLVGILKSKIN